MLHIFLHALVPLLVAIVCLKRAWLTAFIVMMLTMLVDLDHLLATPIYDPNRCSIGFHPLHQPWFIGLYAGLCFVKNIRWIGVGLIIHMALDALDCL